MLACRPRARVCDPAMFTLQETPLNVRTSMLKVFKTSFYFFLCPLTAPSLFSFVQNFKPQTHEAVRRWLPSSLRSLSDNEVAQVSFFYSVFCVVYKPPSLLSARFDTKRNTALLMRPLTSTTSTHNVKSGLSRNSPNHGESPLQIRNFDARTGVMRELPKITSPRVSFELKSGR